MARYSNIKIIEDPKENGGARFYSTTFYPKIPLSENDVYVLTGKGDRLDLLANQFYGDPNLWWVISSANASLTQNSLYPPVGVQLRIPGNLSTILEAYNVLNQ